MAACRIAYLTAMSRIMEEIACSRLTDEPVNRGL